jgi:AraC family transcriptional regulator of adaptative response/methylated-DNA-[protein]-cysteine methyltransferase
MIAEDIELNERDFARIADAIRYLQEHHRTQPSLADVARAIGLSESRMQRLFTAWAGISPKRFLQHLTALDTASLLRDGSSVLSAAFAAGMSGPARVHDLMLNVYGATPGEVASGGAGIDIACGTHMTPFGEAFIAVTSRGVCGLHFLGPMTADEARAEVQGRWPAALLREDAGVTRPVAQRMFARAHTGAPLSLLVSGTNFQLQVWRALLRVPAGSVTTYDEIARHIGAPAAHRAVGTAVGRNPIALLIPCHRVLRKSGELGGYHWGTSRKSAILAWETAGREPALV